RALPPVIGPCSTVATPSRRKLLLQQANSASHCPPAPTSRLDSCCSSSPSSSTRSPARSWAGRSRCERPNPRSASQSRGGSVDQSQPADQEQDSGYIFP